MADLDIRLEGHDAASGPLKQAAGSVENLGESVAASIEVWELAFEAVKVSFEAIFEFTKSSIEAYSESERATKQLALAARDLTDAFEEQAGEMQKKYAVDDDTVKQVQTMLLRFGTAPQDVEAATIAVLNYSAATGTDAVSAVTALVHGVEKGSGSILAMGIHFAETGKYASDLKAAVAKLNEKFGGAAEADAESLTGRMNSVNLAFEDIKKAFGAMIAELERSSGFLTKTAKGLDWFIERVRLGFEVLKRTKFEQGGLLNAADSVTLDMALQYFGQPGSKSNEQKIDEAPRVNHAVGQAMHVPTDAELKAMQFKALERAKRWDRDQDELALNESLRTQREMRDRVEENNKLLQQAYELQEQWARDTEDAANFHTQALSKLNLDSEHLFDQQLERFLKVGDQIGGEIVSVALIQLERLIQGEATFDQVVSHIADLLLTLIGQIIGEIVGSRALGEVLGFLGHLWGESLIADADKKAQRDRDEVAKTKLRKVLHKHHEGGWVERFHAGGWSGPRASEPAQVPRVRVHIRTIDVESTRAFFKYDGGKGFRDALARGRQLPVFGEY